MLGQSFEFCFSSLKGGWDCRCLQSRWVALGATQWTQCTPHPLRLNKKDVSTCACITYWFRWFWFWFLWLFIVSSMHTNKHGKCLWHHSYLPVLVYIYIYIYIYMSLVCFPRNASSSDFPSDRLTSSRVGLSFWILVPLGFLAFCLWFGSCALTFSFCGSRHLWLFLMAASSAVAWSGLSIFPAW